MKFLEINAARLGKKPRKQGSLFFSFVCLFPKYVSRRFWNYYFLLDIALNSIVNKTSIFTYSEFPSLQDLHHGDVLQKCHTFFKQYEETVIQLTVYE